jgi:sulfur carrier protein
LKLIASGQSSFRLTEPFLTSYLFKQTALTGHVYINGEQHPLASPSALSNQLSQAGIVARNGIAVAVNESIVPQAHWSEKEIQANDKITIITATQGG